MITEFSGTSETTTTVTRLNTFTWGLDLSGTLQGAGGVGGLLVQTTVSGGVIERASYDGNGNIVAWTKSNTSTPTSRREYDAFGNTLVSEGAAPCNFGFSTKMQDSETGLYYYGYRYYDPATGRWPSRDLIGERGGLNLYGFLRNDGSNRWDRLGLAPQAQSQINNTFDALEHYQSGAGGVVPAGQDLIDTVKDSADFKANKKDAKKAIEDQVRDRGRSVLCKDSNGSFMRQGKKIGIYAESNALGHIDLKIEDYVIHWKANEETVGFKNISFWADREMSFDDRYEYDVTWNPVTWVTDGIPWIMVDLGDNGAASAPYNITGSFVDRIDGDFHICCWFN